MTIDGTVKELKQALQPKKRPSAYDATATVRRIDGNVAYVHIPGGVDETPVALTVDAKPGDEVRIRVANNTAWIVGNATAPPTDDAYARFVGWRVDVTNEEIRTTNHYVQNLQDESVKIKKLVAEKVSTEELETNYAHIKDGVIDNATIGYADVNDLDTNYAKIDTSNINTATIRNAWIDALMVQSGLIAHEGTVYELDAIQVNASSIKAGTLDVDRLIVTVNNEKYLVHVNPSTGQPSYQKIDGNIIEPRTITADKIVAGAITANEITTQNISGSGGWINLRNGTFNYTNATSGNFITWDGTNLNINANSITLGGSERTLSEVLSDMQTEIEGSVGTWYGDVDPTLNNLPAVEWTTEALKRQHLRNIYFNTTNGHSFRFVVEGDTFKWVQIEDADATKALNDAAAALEAANNANALAQEKKRIFVSTPVPPYDIGDLWVQGSSGDIKKCKNARASGSYTASDWDNASKYTDDTALTRYTSRFSVTPENISSEVKAIANGSEIATRINQTANNVKIQASKVDIEGAAIFQQYTKKSDFDDLTESVQKMEDALELDIVYEWGTTNVTLNAVLMQNGEDIHTKYPASLYAWNKESQNEITFLGNGYQIVIPRSSLNYVSAIDLSLGAGEPAVLRFPDGNGLRFPDGKILTMVKAM